MHSHPVTMFKDISPIIVIETFHFSLSIDYYMLQRIFPYVTYTWPHTHIIPPPPKKKCIVPPPPPPA